MTTSPFGTIRDVVEANERNGYFFFSRGAMAWFHCRIESGLIRGRYFITSEQCEDGSRFDTHGDPIPATERRYAVRYANDDGTINTLPDSSIMAFGSTAEAMEYILQHDNPA